MRAVAPALALALACAACGPGVRTVAGPPPGGATNRPSATPSFAAGWKTLRAEHRVTLDVRLPGGERDRRSLRGAIAIERPDRFRLRALGPGGITLFDLLSVGGKVQVLEAIRDPAGSALAGVIQALAGDLQAAFLLEPAPADRAVSVAGEELVVQEADRVVRLSGWKLVGGKAVATRFVIDNFRRQYTVAVDASGIEVDSALDPALFSD